ncbi:hypothetical protein I4U23_024667 [Adineta vaga]|nr:hypothetical protein I4U23_024667 [Adineta vaga]
MDILRCRRQRLIFLIQFHTLDDCFQGTCYYNTQARSDKLQTTSINHCSDITNPVCFRQTHINNHFFKSDAIDNEDPLSVICGYDRITNGLHEFLLNDNAKRARFYRWAKKVMKQWNIKEENCSLALLLSKVRETVLILSSDPAHNISDAFNKKFTKKSTKVNGYDNLFAMEFDLSGGISELPKGETADLGLSDFFFGLANCNYGLYGRSMFQEMLPSFSVDTAPIGRTLRLLSFSSAIEKGLDKILRLKNQVEPMLTQISSVFDTHSIIVNQVLFPTPSENINSCSCCASKMRLQQKYIEQIDDLYDDFNVVKLPFIYDEVRGIQNINSFSQHLMKNAI